MISGPKLNPRFENPGFLTLSILEQRDSLGFRSSAQLRFKLFDLEALFLVITRYCRSLSPQRLVKCQPNGEEEEDIAPYGGSERHGIVVRPE